MKIWHKLLSLDKSALLQTLGVICGIIFSIYSVPVLAAHLLSAAMKIEDGSMISGIRVSFFIDTGLVSVSYGISGFLMGLIVVLISRSRKTVNVIFAGIFVMMLHIPWWYQYVSCASIPVFFQVYWVFWMIINTAFILGFAVLGIRFINKMECLKVQKNKEVMK